LISYGKWNKYENNYKEDKLSRFNGAEFTYNSISSILYDLRILEFDSGGKQEYDSGVESEIYSDIIYRKSKVNYYGRSVNKVLELDFTIGSFSALSVEDQSLIKNWLLGSPKHVPLRIIQDDMSQIYYNCLITKASDIKVGNLGYALSIHAVCDAPWAWEDEKILNKNYTSGGVETDAFVFFNDSISQDYMYPVVQFTLNGIGTEISLYNVTDDNRLFKFTGLLAGETIVANCYDKILTSSTGLYRLSSFNKNWFRFLPGVNSLNLVGAISNLKITYQLARGG
jgi:phage-related protein